MGMIVKKWNVILMNKNKIMQLADFLDTLPRHRFNISRWSSAFDSDEYYEDTKDIDEDVFHIDSWRYYYLSNVIDVNICNTAGCIAGWAIAMDNGGKVEFPTVHNSEIANNILARGAISLGLTMNQARKLFFTSQGNSVWVNYMENYIHVLDSESRNKVIEEVDFGSDYEAEQIMELFDREDIYISNSVASFVLRLIANEVIKL